MANYDLKASDWCCLINLTIEEPKITFYPVVENVGTKVITGPGIVSIWVRYDQGEGNWISTGNSDEPVPASFKLDPGKTAVLGSGVEVLFRNDIWYTDLVYIFNFDIQDEPQHKTDDPDFIEDIRSGKNNNGRTFFVEESQVNPRKDLGDPKKPCSGKEISEMGKGCGDYM